MLKAIIAIIAVLYTYFMTPAILQDPAAEPPQVAEKNEKPHLTINVSETGTFSHEGKKISAEQLTELCKKEKALQPNIALKISTNKEVKYKHTRQALRAASKGGINNMVLGLIYKENPQLLKDQAKLAPIQQTTKKTIRSREQDLEMALPEVAHKEGRKVPPLEPFFIRIAANGSIFINTGSAQEELDNDFQKHGLPTLKKRLIAYSGLCKVAGHAPAAKIHVNKNATQQRIIDVLSALAATDITKVALTDLFVTE